MGVAEVARRAACKARASFGWHRVTLRSLSTELARHDLSRLALVPTTPLTTLAAAARSIARVRLQGRLGRLEAVVDRPGLVEAAVNTLTEIRWSGLAAERLPDEICALVMSYEAELRDAGLADEPMVVRLATAAARDGFGRIPMLVCDARVRWPIERDLLLALTTSSPDVLATVPAGDTRTSSHLVSALGVQPDLDAPARTSALGRLQCSLFKETTDEHSAADDVTVFSAPGEDRECVEIARRVVHAAKAGMCFDRIAILLRSPTPYRLHLEEALTRAGVPAWWAQGSRLPDPVGRAFLALLACRAEDYSARRFAEYLSLGEVPTTNASDSSEADDEPIVRAPRRWEGLLTEAAVIGGLGRWRRRLAGLEFGIERAIAVLADDPARREREQQRLTQLRSLRDFALPVLASLESLPIAGLWRDWLPPLRDLARAALREPERILNVLSELYAMGPVGPVDLADICRVLGPPLRELASAPPARRSGCVFVGPIDAARGIDFDLVFVPGLAERSFPQRIGEDPLLLDQQRAALGLPTNADRAVEERVALHVAVGAATARWVGSWPRVELDAVRPRVPSFYALEVVRAAEGRLPSFREIAERADHDGAARIGWPAPRDRINAIDHAEYDLAVLGDVFAQSADAARGRARWLLDASPHLGRSLRARWARWSEHIQRWDGLHSARSDAVAAVAAACSPTERAWPATTLELFARCPYRLYLRALQRLAPREDPVPIESIDALSRGSIVHEAIYLVLSELRTAGCLPVRNDRVEAGRLVVERVVDEVAARWHDDLAPAVDRVWNDEVASIRDDLVEWLVRMTDEPEWVPDRFELAFGLPAHARCDAASRVDPLRLPGGLLLRGAIDLVERRVDGAVRVTDFKTGKVRAAAGDVVRGGQMLQPLLYALACESFFPDATVAAGGLWYVTALGGFDRVDVPLNEVSRDRIAEVVRTVDTQVRAAELLPAPGKDECRLCEYRGVCGSSEFERMRRKPEAAFAAVQRVRELP